MYIILYDDTYRFSPVRNVQYVSKGNLFNDYLSAYNVARQLDSYRLYQNIRVCEIKEVYNVETDCQY